MTVPDAALERQRLRVVLVTIGVNVAGMLAASFIPSSDWRTAVAINLINNALLIIHCVRRRDTLMTHLIVFGVVLGFTELAADAWLVDFTRSLDYSPGGGLFIWRSPAWMPFAWEIVGVQFGYIGLRLWERYGVGGLLGAGLLGAVNIPLYEEMALNTHWWRYSGAAMLSHTPYYIILGEFLIGIAIAYAAHEARRERIVRVVVAGAAAGACIFVAYAVAWYAVRG